MRDGRCEDGEEGTAPEPGSGATRPSLSRRWWPLVGASRREWWEGVRTVLCVVEAVAFLTDTQALAGVARALTAVGDMVVNAGKPERP
ncbi:hypothetical protein B9W61_00045 [Streptomyces sp. CS057]|nr:hypothetical protein B9W61_00045 [Streptomyces sp. CS057]